MTVDADPQPSGHDQRPQAVIRIVPRGGAKTARQIFSQWRYLSRNGEVALLRSERHLGIRLQAAQFKEAARSWAVETGDCLGSASRDGGGQALTTHIIISFPAGTNVARSFAVGRAWAEEMFGSGRNGGTFDYVTACHSDRPHPHIHLVVNRRALEGHWLKISRRHAYLNYERLRAALVEIARHHGIIMDASSRVERGITEAAITYAEYRRRARTSTASANEHAATPPSAV